MCDDGGWFGYASAKDACLASRAAPNFYQTGWASLAVALNVLADVLFEQARAVTTLPEDSFANAAMGVSHAVALCSGLLFFVWMLTPELGRVSLPYNLNWVLTVVNGCAWLLGALLLNLSMLRDHSLSPFRRVAWDAFLSYRQRSEKEASALTACCNPMSSVQPCSQRCSAPRRSQVCAGSELLSLPKLLPSPPDLLPSPPGLLPSHRTLNLDSRCL